MKMTPGPVESIKCTASGCSCLCFKPGSVQIRSCDLCQHGWVAHAMEKLHFQAQQPSSCGLVEVALPGLVFDLSSLVLYGTQAIPVQLKILLDRLYSILTSEQVSHILNTLGWSLGDYVRGYMLQFPRGQVLDCWVMVTPEEELLILKQFLRFGETRPIVELMTVQALKAVHHLSHTDRGPYPESFQSNIGTFTDQNGGSQGGSHLVARVCCFKEYKTVDQDDSIHPVENFSDGRSLLLPFQFPSSDFNSLVPPKREVVHSRMLTQCQQKPKVAERHRQEGGRTEQENDPSLEQSNLYLEIKGDPDKPNPAPSIWRQDPLFNDDKKVGFHMELASQDNIFSLSSFLNSTLITASSVHPLISSPVSSPMTSQKFQKTSPFSLDPLPSFSSSFICPLPSPQFSSSLHVLPSSSSSLHPLPSSLCSLPSRSPAGGRKGRVSCGVCGKSFYDKGTLKIHYNAVHLKIKHRCTVAGCTMVFSSLRSRNRHSANPNPRLHTLTSRDVHAHSDPHTGLHSDTQTHKEKCARKNIHNTHTQVCREKDISNKLWKQNDDKQTLVHVHTLTNGFNDDETSHYDDQKSVLPQTYSPPPSPQCQPSTSSQSPKQSFAWSDSRSGLHKQALTPSSLIPVHASSLGSLPSLIPMVVPANEKTKHCQSLLCLHTKQAECDSLHCANIPVSSSNSQPVSCDYAITDVKNGKACTSPPTTHQWQWEFYEPIPKKKSRKSSMPVKIEREKVIEEGNKEDDE